MLIIRNKVIPFKGYAAMNILGFLFVREEAKVSNTLINHEAIHTAQQYEIMGVSALLSLILCNVWASWWYLLGAILMPIAIYILAWLMELILPPYSSAYRDSPFEREAYANQSNLNYLATRPLFAWVRYILKDR